MERLSCDLAKELTAPLSSVVLAGAPRRARRPEPTPQLACRMIRPDKWYRIGWDGAGAPGGASLKARARRGERRTWRRAAAPLDLKTAQFGSAGRSHGRSHGGKQNAPTALDRYASEGSTFLGSFTPDGGISVQESAGGDDQSPGPLKSSVPSENWAPRWHGSLPSHSGVRPRDLAQGLS